MEKLPAVGDYKYHFGDPGFLRNYHDCLVPYPFWETLGDIDAFEAREGDIVIVTFPKCGTGLASAVVHMMQNDADPKCLTTGILEKKIPFLEWCAPDMAAGTRPIDLVNADKSPQRTFYSHLSYSALPESIRKKTKIIYIARNPKDTIVSMHNICLAAPSYQYNLTLEETFESFMNNRCVYSPFYEHVANFWNQQKFRDNIFFTTFESLLKNFKGTCKELGSFIGKDLSDAQLDTMMYHCNFDVMKANDCVNRSWSGFWDFTISPYMRAGKVGNWQAHFSKDLDDRVNDWITTEETRLSDKLCGFSFEYTMS